MWVVLRRRARGSKVSVMCDWGSDNKWMVGSLEEWHWTE